FAFAAVTGFSPSVCRAALMQTLLIAAPLWNRRSDGITSVFAALIVLLARNPYSARHIGLQLSFLSTLGIVTLTPAISEALLSAPRESPRWDNKLFRRAATIAAASLSSTAGALAFSSPLLGHYFGYVSLAAPVANFFALPAAGALFVLGLLASLFGIFWALLGAAFGGLAALFAWWIESVARFAARLPYASVYVTNPYFLAWIVYVYIIFGVLALLRARMKRLLYPVCGTVLTLSLALALCAASAYPGTEVTMINVGQGQCIAVTDGGAAALIDCGSTTTDAFAAADAFLSGRGTTRVDIVILTHYHDDHANGVPALLERRGVKALIAPAPDEGDAAAEEILALALLHGVDIIFAEERLELTLGSARITLYPPEGIGSGNERCLAAVISRGEWDVLVTGDLDGDGEEYLTESYDLPDVEVLIAGHHGSKYSSTEAFLSATRPETALISVGENNYGHPSRETILRLRAFGCAVYRTDINGNVSLRAERTWE
ncbi:MAG: ComEC/Rec2 family competence protein, partial [Oscillospiraceae bacterium]|nr:ComEC/Rec2 family competence protein [Oscillospiraceae bacterium]